MQPFAVPGLRSLSSDGPTAGQSSARPPWVSRRWFASSMSPIFLTPQGDLSWIHDDPHLIVHDDGTFVLDNDWWLNEEAGTTFPPEVVDHLRRNPRRPITMAAMRARRSAARCTFPRRCSSAARISL